MASVYPDLNLSQVVINDTVPPTTGGAGTAIDEADDSIHIVKEDGEELDVKAVDQPAPEGPAIPDGSTALESSSAPDGPFVEDLHAPDASSS